VSGAEKAAKAAIRAKAGKHRVIRVVSLRWLDGVMGNLLRIWCYLIITAAAARSILIHVPRLLDGKSRFL
jgi:hypothetical protein